ALCVRIVWRNSRRRLKLVHRLCHSALLHESFAEIVVVLALIWPKLQRLPKIGDRFVHVAARGQERAEIAVSHPGARISRNRCSPNRFDVDVLATLLPR